MIRILLTTFHGRGYLISDGVINKGSNVRIDEFDCSQFTGYPDPVEDVWNITRKQGIERIQVFEIQGKKVIILGIDLENASTDTSGKPYGIYFVKVSPFLMYTTSQTGKEFIPDDVSATEGSEARHQMIEQV